MNPFPVNPDLLAHLVDGVLVVDADGIVQYANNAAEQMFAGIDTPLVGFHFGITISPDGGAVTVNLPGNGKFCRVELRTNEVEWQGGRASLVSLRDVTEGMELNERNRELSRIVESSQDAIIGMDLEGIISSWNAGAEFMYAYTPEQAIGLNIRMLSPPGLENDASRILEKIKNGESIHQDQTLRLTADGRLLNISLTASPVLDESGRIIGASKIERDVTAHVEAQARIVHLNQVLRAIREVNRLIAYQQDPGRLIQETCDIIVNTGGFTATWILLINEEDEIVQASHAGRNNKTDGGFSAAAVGGKLPGCCLRVNVEGQTVITKDNCKDSCPLAELCEANECFIASLTKQDVSYGLLCVSSEKHFKPDSEDMVLINEVAGDLAMALRDIDLLRERERVLNQLRRQDELLNATGEMARVGGWDIHLEDGIVHWTKTTRLIHEVPEDYVPSMDKVLDFYQTSRAQVSEAVRSAREEGTSFDLEVPFITAKKNHLWVRIMGKSEMENGVCVRLHGVIQDITEQREAEQKKLAALEVARREGDLVRLMVENGVVGFIMIDREGMIIEANTLAEKILGLKREELLTRDYKSPEWHITDVNGKPFPEEQLPVRQVLDKGMPVRNIEHAIQWPTGEQRILNFCAGPLFDAEGNLERVACTVEDVTERRSVEAQLIQSQKMDSIGKLAGGVAHDFNNLLMGVMGYAELSRELLEEGHQVREWLDAIIKEAERSANLTRQLLAFARKQTISPRVLELNKEVEGILKMLRRLIGEDVELGWYPGSGDLKLKMDPGQIDQILANLCVNARDAIGGVGQLFIRTSRYGTDKPISTTDGKLEAGSYVLLEVADNGAGMDSQTLEHIFEPFFTTKEVGHGTGLGLATVYGIIKQNHGGINVQSLRNKGTTFKIYLPAYEGESEDDKNSTLPKESIEGHETILLVEDEKSIRETMSLCLSYLGYRVLKAEDPKHALDLVSEEGNNINLLISDVIMPGMNGRELAERITKDNPALKVLYISGYTADIIADRGGVDEKFQFLAKPVDRDTLAAKVREILDA